MKLCAAIFFALMGVILSSSVTHAGDSDDDAAGLLLSFKSGIPRPKRIIKHNPVQAPSNDNFQHRHKRIKVSSGNSVSTNTVLSTSTDDIPTSLNTLSTLPNELKYTILQNHFPKRATSDNRCQEVAQLEHYKNINKAWYSVTKQFAQTRFRHITVPVGVSYLPGGTLGKYSFGQAQGTNLLHFPIQRISMLLQPFDESDDMVFRIALVYDSKCVNDLGTLVDGAGGTEDMESVKDSLRRGGAYEAQFQFDVTSNMGETIELNCNSREYLHQVVSDTFGIFDAELLSVCTGVYHHGLNEGQVSTDIETPPIKVKIAITGVRFILPSTPVGHEVPHILLNIKNGPVIQLPPFVIHKGPSSSGELKFKAAQ